MTGEFSFEYVIMAICYPGHLEVNLSFGEWEDMRP